MHWLSLRPWLFPASARRRPRYSLQLECLENRLAPATLVNPGTVTFQDVDGDTVTVKLTQKLLTADNVNSVFTFDAGSVNGSNATGQQLLKLDLTSLTPAAHSTLGVTVSVKKGATGDGLTDVGNLNGAGLALGAVLIAGNLDTFAAGSMQSLSVQTLGDLASLTAHSASSLPSSTDQGNLGSLTVKGDVDGARVFVTGTIGTITIGGSLLGGTLDFSGNIFSIGGTGMVAITHDLQGGGGKASGEIATDGALAGATVGGSILGGGGTASGQIFSVQNMGVVTVKGSITGNSGDFSGAVTVSTDIVSNVNNPNAALAGITVGGSVTGGSGTSSGQIFANGDITGQVAIGGNLAGSTGNNSGEVYVNNVAGKLAKGVTIGGSITGDQGKFSGELFTKGSILGPVVVMGDLKGGGSTAAGAIGAALILKSVTLHGSVTSGTGGGSGAIQAGQNLGSLTIDGDVTGSAATPVVISAVGPARPTGLTDIAIDKLTVKGNVTFLNILAGYDLNGNGVNADAQVGTVAIGKAWASSNLIAGIGAGTDNVFGTNDDVKFSGPNVTDVGAIVSMIGSLSIGGTATGTSGSNFGIEAEYIAAAKVNGHALPLDPTVNDTIALDNTLKLQELP